MFLITGLKCYTCSTTSTDYDDNCVSSPTEDMSRDCNKKYCNIIRVEDKVRNKILYRWCPTVLYK